MDEKIVGLRLKLLREKSNLSQGKLAREIGVSQPVITKYEAGIIYPSYPILIKCADYFNVSTDYLLGRTDTQEVCFNKDIFETEMVIENMVERCFDSTTLVNAKLKEALRELLKGGR